MSASGGGQFTSRRMRELVTQARGSRRSNPPQGCRSGKSWNEVNLPPRLAPHVTRKRPETSCQTQQKRRSVASSRAPPLASLVSGRRFAWPFPIAVQSAKVVIVHAALHTHGHRLASISQRNVPTLDPPSEER